MIIAILKRIRELFFRVIRFSNYMFFIIFKQKSNIKYLKRKFEIFIRGVEIGDNIIPWIPIKAKIWLDKILDSDMILYEFGSGLSTLYFSQKVKKIISLEHDKVWYTTVQQKLLKKKIDNCEYYLIEPEKIEIEKSKGAKTGYKSKLRKYKNFHFKKYAHHIDQFPNKYFDLIFIDGRVRITCIKNSIKKIKSGGYLVLDNSDEIEFKSIPRFLKSYKKQEFFGLAPMKPYLKHSKISFWKFTVWKIK